MFTLLNIKTVKMPYEFQNKAMAKRTIIFLILTLALYLRLYDISRIPPSPSLDEVSIGYNAYSMLHTGKDEYGNAFPILLRAYDDFRPALYAYLVVPFVWMLGLTPIAVRLPSVLLGVLVVYVTYRIGRMIGFKYFGDDGIGRFSALILAISPWHIYISRLGHEVNAGLAFMTLGVYFFLSFVIDKKHSHIIWSAVWFALSLHGYQSQKIIAPLLLFVGAMLYRHELAAKIRFTLTAVIIGCIIALPAMLATLGPEGLVRYRATSAFDPHASKLENVVVAAKNYASHFSPLWLFTGYDREAHKTPGMGLLYLWEVPLLVLGLWVFWRSAMPKKLKIFFMVWLLSSPIPAAITTQAPHAMRSFTFIPPLQLLSAMGLGHMLIGIRGRGRVIAGLCFGLIVAVTFGKFIFAYEDRFPKEQSDSFQYAIGPAIAYALEHENEYQKIEFSHQGALYQSYMFYLFYSRLDPKQYLESGGTKSGGYEATHYIGKYAFGFIPENENDLKPKTLYFYDAGRVPQGVRQLETFTNLDGKPSIVAGTL